MSDTPRTDAAEADLNECILIERFPGGGGWRYAQQYVPSSVARQIERDLAAVTAERDHLQRFKDYVHKRLDDAGIRYENPDSPHTAAGCRIGGRLDDVLHPVAVFTPGRLI